MFFRNLFRSLKSSGSRQWIQPVVCRPSVEALEDRMVPAALSVGNATIMEGNAGIQYAEVVVSLDAPSKKSVAVNYSTQDGTAFAGSDYDAVSGKLTSAPGETSSKILVPVRGDRLGEGNENFIVQLTRPRFAKIADAQGVVTILDNEPQVTINNATISEGNSGATIMTFDVFLSTAYDQTVTLEYATVDDSATTADNDYVATFGTLIFLPGETSQKFTVEIIGDTTIEPDERFFVNLSDSRGNAFIAANSNVWYEGYAAAGIIHSDDIDICQYVCCNPNGCGGGWEVGP